MNSGAHASFSSTDFPGYMPTRGIAGSYGSFIPSFLKNLHTVLGEGNGNPLQYSCLENHIDRAAWWATVHGVAKSQTQLSN